jgi:hypothetical protein
MSGALASDLEVSVWLLCDNSSFTDAVVVRNDPRVGNERGLRVVLSWLQSLIECPLPVVVYPKNISHGRGVIGKGYFGGALA